jgi:hypothetical protein
MPKPECAMLNSRRRGNQFAYLMSAYGPSQPTRALHQVTPSLTLAVQACSFEPFERAFDGVTSTLNDAAAVLVAHGNMGSRHSFRRYLTLLSSIVLDLRNSRTARLNPWRHRVSTMDTNTAIAAHG